MPLRAVFDTNALLSGLLYRGRPHLCLRMASEGLVRSVTCEYILAELREKLIERFGFDTAHADAAATMIRHFSDCVAVSEPVAATCRDPGDNHVIACAAQGQADLIVTGDKDILVLSPLRVQSAVVQTRVIEVVTPAQFLALLPGRL